MGLPPRTEADVVYALVEVRKLLEQSGQKSHFPRLVFFCDWIVHPWLTGAETQNVVTEIDARLRRSDPAKSWEVDADGKMHELLSLRRFAQELNCYCRAAGIDEKWTGDGMAWREVSRLYSEVVRDCPLKVSRRSSEIDYLASLELVGCEPSEVLVKSNPLSEHIGWNWRFTLSDGRTFNTTFTAGAAREISSEVLTKPPLSRP